MILRALLYLFLIEFLLLVLYEYILKIFIHQTEIL